MDDQEGIEGLLVLAPSDIADKPRIVVDDPLASDDEGRRREGGIRQKGRRKNAMQRPKSAYICKRGVGRTLPVAAFSAPLLLELAHRSANRGMMSTRLQGRWRLSSWAEMTWSHPSFTAPVEPGRQKTNVSIIMPAQARDCSVDSPTLR